MKRQNMKKNVLYTMLFAVVALLVTSCGDKETEGKSRFTYYPTIELEGDTYLVWDKGTPFVDPGYVSTMNGEDVTAEVMISGTPDVNKSGIYTMTYTTKKNDDGFDASASRTVVVLDPNSAVEGFYLTQPDSYRTYNGNEVAFGNAFEILVIDNGDGTLYVDDLFGGWYCQRAGYGTKYAMGGTISLAADGTVGLISSLVPGWGDGLDDLTGSFADGVFTVDAVYNKNTMHFYQTWVKE
jgi:hypothetical protein